MKYTVLRQQLIDAFLAADSEGAFPVRRVVTEIDVPAPWEPEAKEALALLWDVSDYAAGREAHVVVTARTMNHARRGVGGRETEVYEFLVEVYQAQENGTDGEARFLAVIAWLFTRMRGLLYSKWAGSAWNSFDPTTQQGPTLVEYRGFRCHYAAFRFGVEALADTES